MPKTEHAAVGVVDGQPREQPAAAWQWPTWQNRDLTPIPGIDSSSLSSDSTGSSSSSSSSTEDEGCCHVGRRGRPEPDFQPSKRQRLRRWRLKFRVHDRLGYAFPAPLSYTLHEGAQRRRTFIHVPCFLNDVDTQLVHALRRHPSVQEIRDRKNTLIYRHVAYRVELPMRAHGNMLYQRLMDLMVWSDAAVWKRLARNKKVYPEAEYIVYDARGGVPGEIEPHVDNDAAVTIVVLLSDPSEFKGGVNCFAPADDKCYGATHRQLPLQKGDAVLFRGEKLQHWITPVLGGVRTVLQIELSRV